MASRDIHGKVVMDVTANTAAAEAELKAALDKTVEVKVDLVFPSKAELQEELNRKTGKGLKLYIDSLDLPLKGQMQGELDSKVGTGLRLKIAGFDLPKKAELQAELDKKTGAGLKLFIDELNMPGKKEIQGQLDNISGKDGSSGLKLWIDELNLPGKQEIQGQLDAKSGKDGARGLKLFIDELDLPFKAEMQGQLDARVGVNGLKLRVNLQIDNKSFAPVIAQIAGQQKAITAIEAKELLKRETARDAAAARALASNIVTAEKLAADRQRIADRLAASQTILEERNAGISQRNQEVAALRTEIIQENLRARLAAADDAFQKRRQFAAEAAQRRLENQARRPILQTVLINGQALSRSLADFDRAVSGVLRTSLGAFTIWSAGVTAAVTAAAAAGVVAFAQLEQAGTRAAAVVASQQRVAEIERYGKAITDFSTTTAEARARIEEVAQRVALRTLFNPTEIAAGVQQLVQSGQTLEEAFTNIATSANFATVNSTDLDETTKGLATSLAAAGLPAEQSALLLDKISLTAAAAVGDVEDYFDAFANGAASAGRIIGATTDETLFVLRLLGQAGTLGLTAGTQADIIFRDLGRAAIKAKDEWEAYGITATGTIAEQLVGLAGLIEQTGDNRIAQAQLRKDLGFQEKSFRAISRIIPQITALGSTEAERLAAINRELGSTANAAGGLVELQLGQLRRTVSFQFDQLKDSVIIAFQEIGRGAAPAVSELFDVFAGTGGLIERSIPTLQEYGRALGEIVGRAADFVQTDAFINGVQTIEEAVKVTLRGVSAAFAAFSSAFEKTEPPQSIFESIADSILAFAQVSATVLPVVAKIIGEVFDFLIDNADAFETFAKLTLAVFAARKAWSLLVAPVLASANALFLARDALIAWSVASNTGAVKNALVFVATQLGLITTQANAATAAFGRLAAAETAAAAASVRNTAGAGALALGTKRQQKGLFGSRQVGQNLASQRRLGVEELATGAALSNADLLRRNRNLFQNTIDPRDFVRQRGAVGGVEALDPLRAQQQGRGLFGFNQRQQTIADQARKGLEDIGRPARGAQVGKTTSSFAKLGEVLSKFGPAIGKIGPAIGGLVKGLAKVAGPIGIIIALVEGAVGVFQGFFEELKRGAAGGEVGATLKELEPVFDGIASAAKFTFDLLFDILGIVGAVGKSIGRVLGGIVNDFLVNFGDGIRAIKLFFDGEFIEGFKALGDIIVNTITAPFRLAIGIVLDLLADVFGTLRQFDKFVPGSPIADATEKVRDAAAATRDFRLNMSEAETSANGTSEAVKDVDANARAAAQGVGFTAEQLDRAALSAEQLRVAVGGSFKALDATPVASATQEVVSLTQAVGGFQAQIDVTGQTAARAWSDQRLQATIARDAIARFGAATANAFGGIYDGLRGIEGGAGFAATQVGGIEGAFRSLQSSAASGAANIIQNLSSIGQQATIVSAQLQEVANDAVAAATAQLPEGQTLDPIQQGIVAGEAAFQLINPDVARRQRLLANAEQNRADQKFLEENLPPLTTPTTTGGGGGGARAAQREFVDPNIAIQAAIDRLKPAQKAAEVQRLIDKAAGAATRSFGKLKTGTEDAGEAVELTRRETLLLADAMPQLDKAIETQRKEIEKLDTALSDLQNTQLKGTQAFSDAAFENEQSIKRLQLARLDALAVAGTTEASPEVKAIDDEIKALQLAAERASLEESLQLDPLRRKLEQTFNPVTEDTFGNIIARFKELSSEQAIQSDQLAQREAQQERLNTILEASQQRFAKIDEAAQRSVEAFNKAQTAASGTSTAISTVATSAGSAARNVNRYSTALENVPGGQQVVDGSLANIDTRIQEQAEQFRTAGRMVVSLFTQGVNAARFATLRPALALVVTDTLTYMRSIIAPAKTIGQQVMGSFLSGLKIGFGTPQEVGSVAWYLNVFIPNWIRDNKGPVSYDATILVPAGQAVMEGFGKGLRTGFAEIQGFVKDVGPSLKEYVTGAEFSDRTATIMADIALGKTPDIEAALGDLRLSTTPGAFTGFADPALSFLAPTGSLADTIRQAYAIVAALGGGLNTGGPGMISRPDGTTTSSGNVSAHSFGTAADIGTGGPMPTAASLKLFEQAKDLLGVVFRQVIHNGRGFNAGGGSFSDSQHYDHVHLEWLRARGFAEDSGFIAPRLYRDIPGASDRVDQAINAAANKYGVELALLAAIAKQESGFRVDAGSPAGARGLFQFMPATAAGFGIDPLDPFEAAEGGARFIKNLLRQFDNSLPLALAGYNAGPGAVEQYGGIPPFAETQNYVRQVTKYLAEFRRLFGGFRETGGPVQAGKAYVVGERRPELFVPNRSGRIMPDTSAMGGGMQYTDNRQINVTTAATDPALTADLIEARTRTRFTGVNFR